MTSPVSCTGASVCLATLAKVQGLATKSAAGRSCHPRFLKRVSRNFPTPWQLQELLDTCIVWHPAHTSFCQPLPCRPSEISLFIIHCICCEAPQQSWQTLEYTIANYVLCLLSSWSKGGLYLNLEATWALTDIKHCTAEEKGAEDW